MTPQEKLNQFVNDVYLTRFNRFVDGLMNNGVMISSAPTDTDAIEEITKTVRWTNMLLDELERELDIDGQPINWQFARTNDESLGTIATVNQVFTLPTTIQRLMIDSERPLILMFGSSIISRFEVVDANQITRRAGQVLEDKVAQVGRNLVFSRPFKTYEIGATVNADTIHYLPRLVSGAGINTTVLDQVQPYEMLVLGVAKNATLPDIVQGGLSPSFVQKYGDLLENAKAENGASSNGDENIREDFGSIGGIF